MNYLKNIYTKKYPIFLLIFLSFAGISLAQRILKTKVFILAGQSNMDGRKCRLAIQRGACGIRLCKRAHPILL